MKHSSWEKNLWETAQSEAFSHLICKPHQITPTTSLFEQTTTNTSTLVTVSDHIFVICGLGLKAGSRSTFAPFFRTIQGPLLMMAGKSTFGKFPLFPKVFWRCRSFSAALCSAIRLILSLRQRRGHRVFWFLKPFLLKPVREVEDEAKVFRFSNRVVSRLHKVRNDKRLVWTLIKRKTLMILNDHKYSPSKTHKCDN